MPKDNSRSIDLDSIFPIFLDNVNRMGRLIQLCGEFRRGKTSRDLHDLDDILRSVVVLSHATLEDAVREFVRQEMRAKCSVEVLDTIPLIGISPTNRARKFSLGELSRHRGETVDEVIGESIDEFLNRTSFSSSRDIAGTIEMLGINLSGLDAHFAALDEMITRRHQIVHRADREPEGKGVAPIDMRDVARWAATTIRFIFQLYLEATGFLDEWGEDSTNEVVEVVMSFREAMERLDTLAQGPDKQEPGERISGPSL